MKKITYKQAINPNAKNRDSIPEMVTGYDFGIPGLAVRKVWGTWQIDHVPSGYRAFANLHSTRAACVNAALEANAQMPGIDWTADASVITSAHLRDAIDDWRYVFNHGRLREPIPSDNEIICHGWTMADLEAFLYGGMSEGLCGACGEVSGNHEPDATNNWCPCCDAKKVTSALVLAGVI